MRDFALVRARWALSLLLSGCGARVVAPLPDPEGFGTVILAPRDGGAFTVIAPPYPELALELDAPAFDVLMYRATPEALVLLPGALEPAPASAGEPLPRPDRALSLEGDGSFAESDPSPWASRRVALQGCRELVQREVELGVPGTAAIVRRWSDSEALVGTLEGDLFRVTPEGVAASTHAAGVSTTWSFAVEPGELAWVVHTSTHAGSVLGVRAFDASLSIREEHALPTGLSDTFALHRVVVGRAAGRLELFASITVSAAHLPRIVRWREDEPSATVLDWPGPNDRVSACSGFGIFRSSLYWEGPDAVASTLRTDAIIHLERGAVRRELLAPDACGGRLLDEDPASGVAILGLQDPFESAPTRLFVREGEGRWAMRGEDHIVGSGFGLVRWRGRVYSAGDGLIELTPRASADFRVCPILGLTELARVEDLAAVGEQLVAVGRPRRTDRSYVSWLRPP